MSETAVLDPAHAYHASGVGHCNCADIVRDHLMRAGVAREDSTWVGLANVVGFALEAALKAYLAKHDMTRDILSRTPYGHNLRELLSKATEFGLAIDGRRQGQPELIDALARYVSLCGEDYKKYNYRYLELPSVSVLNTDEAIRTVIRAIRIVLELSISRTD